MIKDQRKLSQVKHGLTFFNTYLTGNNLPEFDSPDFRREFITHKLVVNGFCKMVL